jgi:hypothetical protein
MDIVRQQVLRQQLFQEQEQLHPQEQPSSDTPANAHTNAATSTTQELHTINNAKTYAANKRRDCMLNRNLPQSSSSRASLPVGSNHSTTFNSGFDNYSLASQRITSTQINVCSSTSTASMKVIDAIIQREKQLQKCFTVDCGVGHAETFVKMIQSKGLFMATDYYRYSYHYRNQYFYIIIIIIIILIVG